MGHVPKCLAPSFVEVMDNGGTILAEVKGDSVPSFEPWPAPDQEEGGAVLPCDYTFSDIDTNVYFAEL